MKQNSATKTDPVARPVMIGAIALLVTSLLPVFFSPLVADWLRTDRALSTHITGVVISVNLAGLAVGALMSARLIVGRQMPVAVGGLVLACLGWLAVAVAAPLPWILVSMAIVGLGSGAASAAGNAILATVPRHVRSFSIATVSTVLVGSALVYGMSLTGEESGAALFVVAAFTVAICALLLLLPRTRRQIVALQTFSVSRSAPVADPGTTPARHSPHLWLVMVATLVISIGISGMWTFSEEVGLATPLSKSTVIAALSITQILGLGGAFLSWGTNGRVGRVHLLVFSVLGIAVGNVLIVINSSWLFLAGLLLINISYYAYLPLVYALGSQIDLTGRTTATIGAMSLIGSFLAPTLAGMAAGNQEIWWRLGVLSCAATLLGAVFLAVFRRRVPDSVAATLP